MMMMMVVVMVMVMVVVVMVVTGDDGRARSFNSRRGVLARDLVENARHRFTGAGGDRIDAIGDARHDARDRILSHGELRRDDCGRETDKGGDSNFLHDSLSVNLHDCIVGHPKIISPSRNVHRCCGIARDANCSGY